MNGKSKERDAKWALPASYRGPAVPQQRLPWSGAPVRNQTKVASCQSRRIHDFVQTTPQPSDGPPAFKQERHQLTPTGRPGIRIGRSSRRAARSSASSGPEDLKARQVRRGTSILSAWASAHAQS